MILIMYTRNLPHSAHCDFWGTPDRIILLILKNKPVSLSSD